MNHLQACDFNTSQPVLTIYSKHETASNMTIQLALLEEMLKLLHKKYRNLGMCNETIHVRNHQYAQYKRFHMWFTGTTAGCGIFYTLSRAEPYIVIDEYVGRNTTYTGSIRLFDNNTTKAIFNIGDYSLFYDMSDKQFSLNQIIDDMSYRDNRKFFFQGRVSACKHGSSSVLIGKNLK